MKKALKPPKQMADQPALTLANTVYAAIFGNPNFSAPSPALTTLQGAITAYTASLAKAEYGSRDDRAQKNADKQNLLSILRDLCDYVNSVALGDVTILAGCGYRISKDPQPSVLGTPVLKVENGVSGQLIASSPAAAGAVAYKHQYTADAAAPSWSEILSTKAKCKINDLTPGTQYSVRIVAIGTNDQVTFSSVVTKMVA
jgi:hypothetical protein